MFRAALASMLVLAIAVPVSADTERALFRVGVSLPLTGDASAFGADIKDALNFANQAYAGSKLTFVFEDDKCSGRDATTIAQKFASVDKVAAVTGFGCSESLLAAAPVYERAKILVVSAGTAAPGISEAGDYIFRTYPSDMVPTALLANYVSPRHKKFGILVEDTSYPNGFADAFVAQKSAAHLSIQRESFLPGTTDFRSLLTRLRTQGIDGLLIVATTDRGLAAVIRQIKELNWKPSLYSSYFAGSPTFLKEAGTSADGIIFPDFPSVESVLSSDSKKLYQEFRSKFGSSRTSDFYFVTGASAVISIAKALGSSDPKSVLYGSQFEGPSGVFSFDANGDVRGIGQTMRVIRGGKAVNLNEGATDEK